MTWLALAIMIAFLPKRMAGITVVIFMIVMMMLIGW